MASYIDLSYEPSRNDLIAEYYVEPNRVSLEEAAENIAKESSIGTWTSISTMKDEIMKRLRPNVYSIDRESNVSC